MISVENAGGWWALLAYCFHDIHWVDIDVARLWLKEKTTAVRDMLRESLEGCNWPSQDVFQLVAEDWVLDD